MKTSIIKRNLKTIGKTWFIFMGSIFSALSVILSFISWEDIGISKTCNKILGFIIIIVVTLVVAIIWICVFKQENTIWENGSGKITVRYDDIMKIAFPKKYKKNKIVVIPVNTCFDTQVDEDIAKCDKPLVSPKTIHGRWIKNMIASGISKEDIDSCIDEYMNFKGINPIKTLSNTEKSRGKIKCYENGTIVVLEGQNGITYFLMALSEFDKNNRAQSSKESIVECLKKLLDFYDGNGQGFEIFITLMGTGLSRSGMSHEEALQTIKSVFQLYSDSIHGEFNIIIYHKDKGKVSIFD